MPSSSAKTLFEYATLQSIAESYLHLASQVNPFAELDIRQVLNFGVNHPVSNVEGASATRLTQVQIDWLTPNYDIALHVPNDPASGLSATIFKNRGTGEFVLSFRSTEFQLENKGGDWNRDGKPGADGEIFGNGLALAQLAAMENMWEQVLSGKTFNVATGSWEADTANALGTLRDGSAPLVVTGYSLGGHLSTAFTLLYADRVTDSMKRAMGETERRRNKQLAFNLEHGIEPRSVRKAVRELIDGIVAPAFREQPEDLTSYALLTDEKALAKEFRRLEKLMLDHARNLEFEQAAAARDALKVLKDRVLLSGA